MSTQALFPGRGTVPGRFAEFAAALSSRLRRVTDPVADCVREAAAVRRQALQLMARDPAMAADLYAAADRHEREAPAAR